MHFDGIAASLKHCKILMYADDTVIYYPDKNISDIEQKLKADFSKLISWFRDNQLIINMKKGKTECMLFGTEQRLNKLSDNQLDIEQHVILYKYLGLHLYPSLNMNVHIDKTYKIAVGRLKLLAKTRLFLTVKAALTIYESMILPLFTYCSLLKINATNTQKKRMEAFERRASVVITGKVNKSNALSKIPSLETIQKKKCWLLTFRF